MGNRIIDAADRTGIEQATEAVQRRLEAQSPDSPADVYVWADLSVTGPPGAENDDDSNAIAVFSPGDVDLSIDDIRRSILRGLEAAPVSDEKQEPIEPPSRRGGP